MSNDQNIELLLKFGTQCRYIIFNTNDSLEAIETKCFASYDLEVTRSRYDYQIQFYDSQYEEYIDLYEGSLEIFRSVLRHLKLLITAKGKQNTKEWRLKFVEKLVSEIAPPVELTHTMIRTSTKRQQISHSKLKESGRFQVEREPYCLSNNTDIPSVATSSNGCTRTNTNTDLVNENLPDSESVITSHDSDDVFDEFSCVSDSVIPCASDISYFTALLINGDNNRVTSNTVEVNTSSQVHPACSSIYRVLNSTMPQVELCCASKLAKTQRSQSQSEITRGGYEGNQDTEAGQSLKFEDQSNKLCIKILKVKNANDVTWMLRVFLITEIREDVIYLHYSKGLLDEKHIPLNKSDNDRYIKALPTMLEFERVATNNEITFEVELKVFNLSELNLRKVNKLQNIGMLVRDQTGCRTIVLEKHEDGNIKCKQSDKTASSLKLDSEIFNLLCCIFCNNEFEGCLLLNETKEEKRRLTKPVNRSEENTENGCSKRRKKRD